MNRYLILSALAIFFAGVCYLLVGNLLLSLATLLLFLLALLGSEYFFFAKKRRKEKIERECFSFCRSFLLSTIASGSYEEAYKAATLEASKEFMAFASANEEKAITDRLRSFAAYFANEYYRLFLSIIDIYESEGGEIVILSEPFLLEITEKEKDIIRRNAAERKAVGEFSILIFLSALIMAFLRYGLSGFYETLSKNSVFVGCAMLYFFFIAASIIAFSRVSSGIRLIEQKKGDKNEKIAKNTAKAK